MEKYISEILVTVQKLAHMGEPIDDKWVAFIMMNGVMEEYEALISSLNQSYEKLTAEKVKITLLNESERRRVKSNQVPLSNSASALLADENVASVVEASVRAIVLELFGEDPLQDKKTGADMLPDMAKRFNYSLANGFDRGDYQIDSDSPSCKLQWVGTPYTQPRNCRSI
nr:unnamed protein product [Callosobruchus analis]